MRILMSSLLITLFVLTTPNFAVDLDQRDESEYLAPAAKEFAPNDAWADMLNYVETRTKWFKETLEQLNNTTTSNKDRIALAKKLYPSLHESNFKTPQSWRDNRRIFDYQAKRLINAVISDLLYSSLYWDFLERTLIFYNAQPNKTPEIWAQILPHLACEIVNFDKYAIHDFINVDNRSRFIIEEFYFNRAIHKQCQEIANYYGIEIKNVMLIQNSSDDKPRALALDEIPSLDKLKASGEALSASKKELFYFEQLLFYRRSSSFGDSVPDLSKGKFPLFLSYILPVTGPVLIQEAVKGTKALSLEEDFLTSRPEEKKPKAKKTNSKAKSKAKRAQVKKSKRPDEPKSQNLSLSTSEKVEKIPEKKHSDIIPTLPETETTTTVTPLLDLPQEPAVSAPLIKWGPQLLQVSPHVVPQPIMTRKLTFKDIECSVFQGNSLSYSFKGHLHTFPFASINPACFDLTFLKTIKRMTHLAPDSDKLPNVAEGGITLHYKISGKEFSKIFKLDELFLSGGKHFGREDFGYKSKYKIVNAMQDMLSKEEREKIYKLPHREKRVPLGIAMEQRLRREIIEGAWFANAVDSEAIFLLCLVKKLPSMLLSLKADSEHPVTITHAVISVSSYRDCCSNCQRLIQGFQWRLRDIILGFRTPYLFLDDNFGTLAMVRGHIRGPLSHKSKTLSMHEGLISLEAASHPLFCVPFSQ